MLRQLAAQVQHPRAFLQLALQLVELQRARADLLLVFVLDDRLSVTLRRTRSRDDVPGTPRSGMQLRMKRRRRPPARHHPGDLVQSNVALGLPALLRDGVCADVELQRS
jgi:hypothetical protein